MNKYRGCDGKKETMMPGRNSAGITGWDGGWGFLYVNTEVWLCANKATKEDIQMENKKKITKKKGRLEALNAK